MAELNLLFLVVPKDSLQSMGVPGTNTGKHNQLHSQEKTLLSIRIKTPNYWYCIISWAFFSTSPRAPLVSFKKFDSAEPWEEQLVKPQQCQGQAGFVPGAAVPEPKPRLISSPQADFQPPGWAQLSASSWDGVRAGDFTAGVAWGQAGAEGWGDISGAVQRCDSAQHHSALGQAEETLCSCERLVLNRENLAERCSAWLSAHPHHRAPARFNYCSGGRCLPLPSFSLCWFFFLKEGSF